MWAATARVAACGRRRTAVAGEHDSAEAAEQRVVVQHPRVGAERRWLHVGHRAIAGALSTWRTGSRISRVGPCGRPERLAVVLGLEGSVLG
eukprot:6084966-Prymnesium_polylepis.1